MFKSLVAVGLLALATTNVQAQCPNGRCPLQSAPGVGVRVPQAPPVVKAYPTPMPGPAVVTRSATVVRSNKAGPFVSNRKERRVSNQSPPVFRPRLLGQRSCSGCGG